MTLHEANLNPSLGLVAAPPSRGMVAAGGMMMKDGGGSTLAHSVPDGYELFWNRAAGDGRVDIRRTDASDASTPPRGSQAVDTPEGVKWEIIPVARETVSPAQYVGGPAKPGQPKTETANLSPDETAALRPGLNLRDAARGTRDRLLRAQEGGATLTPAQKQELSAAYRTITQVGERVGEAVAPPERPQA